MSQQKTSLTKHSLWSRSKERGISMVESLLVMGVAGVVLATVFVQAKNYTSQSDQLMISNDIQQIVQATRQWKTTHHYYRYHGVSMQNLVDQGLLLDGMQEGSYSNTGGMYYVDSHSHTLFRVRLSVLRPEECASLYHKMLPSTYEGNNFGVSVEDACTGAATSQVISLYFE